MEAIITFFANLFGGMYTNNPRTTQVQDPDKWAKFPLWAMTIHSNVVAGKRGIPEDALEGHRLYCPVCNKEEAAA